MNSNHIIQSDNTQCAWELTMIHKQGHYYRHIYDNNTYSVSRQSKKCIIIHCVNLEGNSAVRIFGNPKSIMLSNLVVSRLEKHQNICRISKMFSNIFFYRKSAFTACPNAKWPELPPSHKKIIFSWSEVVLALNDHEKHKLSSGEICVANFIGGC